MTTHLTVPTSALLLLALHASAVAEERTPLVVAHRGLLLHAPENTLSNFRACLDLRIGFEFDVQRTKDGILVCIHDNAVDRTTDGTGSVSELPWDKIRELDAGSWFDAKFAGERVPTVDQVLSLVAEYPKHKILIAVDLKAENVEQDVVRLAEKHGVLDKLLFIGRAISEPTVRRTIRETSRGTHVAAVANVRDELPKAVSDPDADWVYVRFLPSKDEIDAVQRTEKHVFIAGTTVSGNVHENWRQAADANVDAVLTDYPLELRSVLRKPTAGK